MNIRTDGSTSKILWELILKSFFLRRQDPVRKKHPFPVQDCRYPFLTSTNIYSIHCSFGIILSCTMLWIKQRESFIVRANSSRFTHSLYNMFLKWKYIILLFSSHQDSIKKRIVSCKTFQSDAISPWTFPWSKKWYFLDRCVHNP